jgi:hypothetical protein
MLLNFDLNIQNWAIRWGKLDYCSYKRIEHINNFHNPNVVLRRIENASS